MKHLRQLCGGLLLVLALSIPAFAGNVHTPGFTEDTQESPVPGDMHTPGLVEEMEMPVLSLILATLFN
jgi:hypothetical protein